MVDDAQVGAAPQPLEVATSAGAEVVQTQDAVPCAKKALHEMGSQEAGAARDQDTLSRRRGCGKVRCGGSDRGMKPPLPKMRCASAAHGAALAMGGEDQDGEAGRCWRRSDPAFLLVTF